MFEIGSGRFVSKHYSFAFKFSFHFLISHFLGIIGLDYYLYLELRGILTTPLEETPNEDPMPKSKVSDSEDVAESRNDPPSSQV